MFYCGLSGVCISDELLRIVCNWYDNQRLIFSTISQQMVLFNKITGQKRKKGMSRHVLSFQQSLSFVERFVENMLSRKCLMFNTSFIIFNNSTKIRGVLSVIFMNRTHPPTSKNVMLMLQYLFTTVRQRQANKQARGHSTKGGCSSIEL